MARTQSILKKRDHSAGNRLPRVPRSSEKATNPGPRIAWIYTQRKHDDIIQRWVAFQLIFLIIFSLCVKFYLICFLLLFFCFFLLGNGAEKGAVSSHRRSRINNDSIRLNKLSEHRSSSSRSNSFIRLLGRAPRPQTSARYNSVVKINNVSQHYVIRIRIWTLKEKEETLSIDLL